MEEDRSPIKEDLLGEIEDVRDGLRVVVGILENIIAPETCAGHGAARIIARDALRNLDKDIARIKEDVQNIDF